MHQTFSLLHFLINCFIQSIYQFTAVLALALFVAGCGNTEPTESDITSQEQITDSSETVNRQEDEEISEEMDDEPGIDTYQTLANYEFGRKYLIGQWEAVSKNHMAICGDMTIDTTLISFANKGDVTFTVLMEEDDHIILKISKDVDDGLFMRLGPITQTLEMTEDKSMEVAYYRTEEEAFAKREKPTNEATSWGTYAKKLSE